ncbi:hypothetical protein AKJ09_06259 [Labilithrix luteola]|uniref:Uncharacterized protein n=1 Tax=Labilithrix luteola TaxID=1391654 RepID=A0A0K1Q1C6_9BACT|nr:hypothetical protein AKJ09_06259 [Labilithrix luteola]
MPEHLSHQLPNSELIGKERTCPYQGSPDPTRTFDGKPTLK